MTTADQVVIDYTNHRGERRERTVKPLYLLFSTSQWHPKLQWILVAFDVEKKEARYFTMKDIHSWRAIDLPHAP